MAGASLFTLLDDIAMLLDDVAVLTKAAAKKTAGVIGDDLALNAQQVTGMNADRELPVVWAVAKGSLLNKVILVPAALAISAFEAWLGTRGIRIPIVLTLMMIGGAFLCFEGVEKLAHRWLHPKDDDAHRARLARAATDGPADLAVFEQDRIRGAVRTDFILSAEIIVLSLGVVSQSSFAQQATVLSVIALSITVGVYGLVAGIVKLDDAGLWLSTRGGAQAAIGRGILVTAPWLMKALSIAGTAAMFLVGGGILVHGVPVVHHALQALTARLPLPALVEMLGNALVGVLAGALVLLAWEGVKRMRGKRKAGVSAEH